MNRSWTAALIGVSTIGLTLACSPASDSTTAAVSGPDEASGDPSGFVLSLPVACVIGMTCQVQNHMDRREGSGAVDYRCGSQTYEDHSGTDIRIPDLAAQQSGVAVLAAAPGVVTRVRDGVSDVSVRAPDATPSRGQECGNGVVIDHGGGWETQYCHLAEGSLSVRVGESVGAGHPIGLIGLSGATEYPHLHLTVRRHGQTIDPFQPEAESGDCRRTASGKGLWDSAAAAALAYQRGAVLNLGFSGGPVTMEQIEAGQIAPPGRNAEALVAFGRGIKLEAADVQDLVLVGPDGRELARQRSAPLGRPMAQYMIYVGKRASGPWPTGIYRATYSIVRDGEVVASRSVELKLGS